MTVYFTASIKGKKQYLESYQRIVQEVQNLGHTIIADHILETSEQHVTLESSEQRQTFHKKLDQWIQSADCVIAETSFPSISVGFEIALALQKRKPVMILYSTQKAPTLLLELNPELLTLSQYTQKTIKSVLEDFFLYAEGNRESRFTFFLNDRQNQIMKQQSKKLSISKSAWLRLLIEQAETSLNTAK